MFPPFPTSRPPARMGGERRAQRPAAEPRGSSDVRQPTIPPQSWRDRVRHAVDLTVAFVLLEDEQPTEPGSAHGVADAHPHRKPLRPMPRPRRPGAVPARAQVCTAPVGHVPPSPPKRRTRLA